ncbi:hypothetical protein [Plasmodium yoelii yoelii]|uniref:Uncharacterized protein n=1 Tax=Plasmodium yoelii yoelii TaxID=73239 RepID=Q7RI11_PLAYO|nr:hypothetical protein [Plasmodium yoelii yoelii]
MVGKIENRNLLAHSNSIHTKDNDNTINSSPISFKKMSEIFDNHNEKRNKKKSSQNLDSNIKEYNDNALQHRRSTKLDNGINKLHENKKGSEISEKTYYYKENSLNNEPDNKLKNNKEIEKKNNSSNLDTQNGLLDISTSIFSAITKRLTEMKKNEKKIDTNSENFVNENMPRKKTILKDGNSASSNNNISEKYNTYETDAYLINDEEPTKIRQQNSVTFDNNSYNPQYEENLIFINNAYNGGTPYNDANQYSMQNNLKYIPNQTDTYINTSEISGTYNIPIDLYNNIDHMPTNVNNPYNNMQFATHAIIQSDVKPSTHLIVPQQNIQPTFLVSNNNMNYDTQNQRIFQTQNKINIGNETPNCLYANTNHVVNPGIVHKIQYESNHLKNNSKKMNRVTINEKTEFYNFPKKEPKKKSLLCNISEKNDKKNVNPELKAEILIYKNTLSNPPKNIKNGTYNIPIKNNVFIRTRSLTPHTYYSKNIKNVSPLKNINIQKKVPKNIKQKIMHPSPICTHEVTYTCPIQNNTNFEKKNDNIPINKLVEYCDNKSELNKCSTEASSIESIDYEKSDKQIKNLNQKIKNLQNKVSELTKTNKNLNELSQMYKNECNRMRETVGTYAIDKNYISPKKIINYEKENLKLEKENEKLREQIKVLGKAILSTHDIAGVKKVLAKQIISLNDENEKFKKEIKELKKKENINNQVMFNINKSEVSVDAVDSIFLQTKNVIIEVHQSINVFYLNLRNLIDEFFEKIKFLIVEDEYTKKEKLLYVTSLEEIINENLTEVEQVETLNDGNLIIYETNKKANINSEQNFPHNVDKTKEINNVCQVANKKSSNKKNEEDNSGLQEKHINYNSCDEDDNESEEEGSFLKNRKFLVEKLTKKTKKGARHLNKPRDTSINKKNKKNKKYFKKEYEEEDDSDFYEGSKENSQDIDSSSNLSKSEDSETDNTLSNKKQWMSDEEVEKSKNKMIELLALLKGKHNEDLVENTENYVKSFGKHKSENEYNIQSIYNNLKAIKNTIKNTDDDTENNILALIESQAAEIKIFGNCIDNLKNTVTS